MDGDACRSGLFLQGIAVLENLWEAGSRENKDWGLEEAEKRLSEAFTGAVTTKKRQNLSFPY